MKLNIETKSVSTNNVRLIGLTAKKIKRASCAHTAAPATTQIHSSLIIVALPVSAGNAHDRQTLMEKHWRISHRW